MSILSVALLSIVLTVAHMGRGQILQQSKRVEAEASRASQLSKFPDPGRIEIDSLQVGQAETRTNAFWSMAYCQNRAPRDHINTRILQNMISGIPPALDLRTKL